MNIVEVVLFVALFGSLGIVGYKAYNLMQETKIYSWYVSILLFCGSALCWFFGLLCYLSTPDTLESIFYQFTFKLISLILIVSIFLSFCEVIYFLKNSYFKEIKAYKSGT